MNTEEELGAVTGRMLLGVAPVESKDLLMFFFNGYSLAVRVEGGALIWELYEEQIH